MRRPLLNRPGDQGRGLASADRATQVKGQFHRSPEWSGSSSWAGGSGRLPFHRPLPLRPFSHGSPFRRCVIGDDLPLVDVCRDRIGDLRGNLPGEVPGEIDWTLSGQIPPNFHVCFGPWKHGFRLTGADFGKDADELFTPDLTRNRAAVK